MLVRALVVLGRMHWLRQVLLWQVGLLKQDESQGANLAVSVVSTGGPVDCQSTGPVQPYTVVVLSDSLAGSHKSQSCPRVPYQYSKTRLVHHVAHVTTRNHSLHC